MTMSRLKLRAAIGQRNDAEGMWIKTRVYRLLEAARAKKAKTCGL